jgi:predicted nucleic-acid-binding Zn-ribbon protein
VARVVCSKCGVDAQVIADDEGNKEAVCPVCGQRDSVEDAIRIAGEHFAQEARTMLNKAMSDAARGSKVIQYKPGSTTRRSFRWKAVDD